MMGRKSRLVVEEKYRSLLAEQGLVEFEHFMAARGRLVCRKRGRSTVRLEAGSRAFYLKRNFFNWVEFGKGLLPLRLPPRGAMQEWRNIERTAETGIASLTPVAFGEALFWGLEIRSFTMTEELYQCLPLDAVLRRMAESAQPGVWQHKRQLVAKVAQLARRLHGAGLFHQDFYLSHIYVDPEHRLHLIDLQRVLKRPWRLRHFQVKDLGQLNYSAQRTAMISRTDRMRFFLHYLDRASLTAQDKSLAGRIVQKTRRIARHDAKLYVRRRRRGELL